MVRLTDSCVVYSCCTHNTRQAVLVPTETVPDTPIIKGHDFSSGGDLDTIMGAMITSGFQATALGQAIEEVNRMVSNSSSSGGKPCQCHVGRSLQQRHASAVQTAAAPCAPRHTPSRPPAAQIDWRLQDDPVAANADPEHADPAFRASCRTKIYLGYTSNLISAGVREQIRWLVQHKMVDVLVTTAGGIEEDFIKCMGHTYMGDFQLKGEQQL